MIKKCLVFGIVASLFLVTITSLIYAIGMENRKDSISIASGGYIDITVEEAWAMLNDPSNGIQIPIDVRSYGEWYGERIDTPYPEDPKHYWIEDMKNEKGLQEFLSLYNGKEIILYCKSGYRSSMAAQILVDQFNGTIYNMLGGITAWKEEGFPTKIGNRAPYQPNKPSGPTMVNIGIPYTYSTSTIDPDNDSIKYGWDWDGDSIVDEWTDYYPSGGMVNTSHLWSTAGIYDVKIIAEDAVGDCSDFSLVLTVVVNNPPDAPSIIGPTEGKAGVEYEYTFVATDPDGDDVYYWIQWGEGCPVVEWIGPYASGEEVTLTNSWDTKGTYTIKAQAKDVHDATSEWGTLEVNMPKSYFNARFLVILTFGREILPGIFT